MTLDNIIDTVNSVCNLDIKSRNRQAEYCIARNVYAKIAMDNMVFNTQTELHSNLGERINRSRLQGRHLCNIVSRGFSCKKEEEVYNKCLVMLNISKKVEDIPSDLSMDFLSFLEELKELTNEDLLEFRDTRFVPFKKLINNRVKPKVFKEVPGARLR